MDLRLVQDYIRACTKMEKEEFVKELGVPVLIGESKGVGLSFSWGQTALTPEQRKSPLTRELIRDGHQLPVMELRQQQPGPAGQVRVGRTKENDLLVAHETVSSRHAVFQRTDPDDTYSLQDLASMNGTRVNDGRLVVGKSVVLFDGDVLAFGDPVFLFFYPGGLYDVLRASLDSF